MRKIKLGKGMVLKYIPLNLLMPPQCHIKDIGNCVAHPERVGATATDTISPFNSRPLCNIFRDRKTLEALKTSIKVNGLLNPLSVMKMLKVEGKYAIIDGQRRFYALVELIDEEAAETHFDRGWKWKLSEISLLHGQMDIKKGAIWECACSLLSLSL